MFFTETNVPSAEFFTELYDKHVARTLSICVRVDSLTSQGVRVLTADIIMIK